jgi:16S rRNA (uracil1498-N3)-methyltransferase
MKFSHLPRLHTNEPIHEKQTIIIEKDNFHYLKAVMRIRENQKFRLFNSQDGEFIVIIKEITRSSLVAEVSHLIREVEQIKNLTLAICLIKQDRMIEAIKSAVQIGVNRIIPIISERTQYQKIAREKFYRCIIQSAEQSERFSIPIFEQELRLDDFCQKFADRQVIFACELEQENKTILNLKNIEDDPIILIGPEGGFSDKEIEMVKLNHNSESISLGRTVLRSETAAISALACVCMVRR